jgi:5-(carboxyamino)imidazole ribonucleotide mutase
MPDIKVAVLMGSDSYLPVMEKAIETLKEFGIKPQVMILSAHRVPDKVAEFTKSARGNGFECIIAGAGLAAHLAGAAAAHTTLPVIGVPLKSGALAGVDALYATVQMPSGIPVATVAIDGAKNAAILAAQILSIKYPDIARKLEDMRAGMRREVEKKSAEAELRYN